MSQDISRSLLAEPRRRALEAIAWRLDYKAFGKLRAHFMDDPSEVILYFIERMKRGALITEQEWLETQEVEA